MKKVIQTRKIELRFNGTNAEERTALYRDLKQWRKVCVKGANQVSAHLFYHLEQAGMIYLTEKAKKMKEDQNFFKEMTPELRKLYFSTENKEIYKVIAEHEKESFMGSIQNGYYQLLSKRFLTECPSAILAALNQRVFKAFNENRKHYIAGTKSIPSYRQTLPIPIPAPSFANFRTHVYKEALTKDYAFTLYGRTLRTNFGVDRSNNRAMMAKALSSWFLPDWVWKMESQISGILETLEYPRFVLNDITFEANFKSEGQQLFYYRLTATPASGEPVTFKMKPAKETVKDDEGKPKVNEDGKKVTKTVFKICSEYKLCDSSIHLEDAKIDDRNGEKKEITKIFLYAVFELEPEPWELRTDQIAYAELSPDIPITVTIGTKVINIGSKDDFTYRRQGIEGSMQRVQRDMTGTQGGKGRKKKYKPLLQYKEYERNVVKDKLHNYSRKLIKICCQNECKQLYLRSSKQSQLDAKEEKLLLRYWSRNGLLNMIKYKTERKGIELIDAELANDDDGLEKGKD